MSLLQKSRSALLRTSSACHAAPGTAHRGPNASDRSRTWTGGFLALALSGASACGGLASDEPRAEPLGADFVSVRKALSAHRSNAHGGLDGAVVDAARTGDDFYLAIRRSLLDSRWFLSAYLQQSFPDNAPLVRGKLGLPTDQLTVNRPLGTRVVSFRLQNERLYVFDASDRTKQSELEDPDLLLEAYPIVDLPEFDALEGSEDYVLVDPARGLNDFSFTGELYADAYLDSSLPLDVGLSYLQNFRPIAGGAAFEQVFAGVLPLDRDGNLSSVWGTLSIALRRYEVGAHYVGTPAPSAPFYLTTGKRFIPDTGGATTVSPLHWDFYPGMEPVEVFVGAGALRAQADFPEVDVLGALTRGIESWNAVFGFPVFKATLVNDDQVRDDAQSFVLVDYPGAGNYTSHGDVRVNPNNGEIRAGNVYYAGGTFDILTDLGLGTAQAPAPSQPEEGSSAGTLVWSGMPAASALCDYRGTPSSEAVLSDAATSSIDVRAEQGALVLQHIMTHEMGHVLGLRHNFKGSRLAPGSSVMDYAYGRDYLALATPAQYDIDAIRYLYQLSPELPAQPFCTDEGVALDPGCAKYDSGASPLQDHWALNYEFGVDQILEGVLAPPVLSNDLNAILGFARSSAEAGTVGPEEPAQAIHAALGRVQVPLSAADAAQPQVVAAANHLADFVLRRMVIDPPAQRGPIASDLTDPGAIDALSEQAGLMLRNADGVRSYELRRTAVDVLKRLQAESALIQLQISADALHEALDGGAVPEPERPLARDLLSRLQESLSSYFD